MINYLNPQTPLIQGQGQASREMSSWMRQVSESGNGVTSPGDIDIPVVTASPYSYNAISTGTVYNSGGTVTALALIRNGVTLNIPVATTFIPVSAGDTVQFTYSSAPSVRFLPR